MKKQYLQELDYIRAIAAIGIFIVHSTGSFAMFAPQGSMVMHLGIVLNQVFRATTPIFLAVSGFVLFYNYSHVTNVNYKDFYLKRLKYIFIPYLAWSFLYLIFSRYLGAIDLSYNTFIQFIKNLIIGETFSHLYFIILIFQLYLLFPFVSLHLKKQMETKPVRLLIITVIAQACILIQLFYFRNPSEIVLVNKFYLYYWKAVSVFGWFYFFLLGGIMALHYPKVINLINKNINKVIVFSVVSFALFLGEVYLNIIQSGGRDYYEKYSSLRPMNLIYATSLLLLLLWVTQKIRMTEKKSNKTLQWISKYSLGIYFAHPFALEMTKIKTVNLFPSLFSYSKVSTLFVIVILAWLVTVSICYGLSRMRWRWVFLGKV